MATWARTTFAFGVLALTACEARQPETISEKLTRLISERVGHRVELHSVETEPSGARAICGLAGDPPTPLHSTTPSAPTREILFIYEGGKLTVADGVVIPAELEERVHSSCPSLTVISLPAVPKESGA